MIKTRLNIKNKILLLLVVAGMMASCGNSYEEQRRLSRAERARLHKEDSLALKVAVMPTLDCMPLFLAKEHCLYDTARLDLRLRYFTAQMDCDTAIVGRSVEGLVSDLVRTERLRREGVPLDYLSSTNIYWQLFTNHKARLKRIDQLGDKMVAMTRYSATDMLTDRALDGVKTSAMVFRIQVNDVNVRLSMMLNNEMDAAWLAEPQATAARVAGHKSVCDSRDMKVNLGVVAFRTDMTKDERRKTQLKAFVEAYNKACDSLNHYGLNHYGDILQKYYKVNGKVAKALPKLKFSHVEKPLQADIDAANGKKTKPKAEVKTRNKAEVKTGKKTEVKTGKKTEVKTGKKSK